MLTLRGVERLQDTAARVVGDDRFEKPRQLGRFRTRQIVRVINP
jgi:hypothetical protein